MPDKFPWDGDVEKWINKWQNYPQEGWDIFTAYREDGVTLEIERDDDFEGVPYSYDDDAWVHVREASRYGSERHKEALYLIKKYNPEHYKQIMEATTTR